MPDITARLAQLRAQAEQAKTEKAKAEATLEQLGVQKQQVVTELATMGVAPENLDAEIAALDAQINDALTQAEQLLTAPIAGVA